MELSSSSSSSSSSTTTTTTISSVLSSSLGLEKSRIEKTLKLLNADCSIPFIARYRKDHTGGLSAQDIRSIQSMAVQIKALSDKKLKIVDTLTESRKITRELKQAILSCQTMTDLESIYAPFKSKKKTKADTAREMGLGPFAQAVLDRSVPQGFDSLTAFAIHLAKNLGISVPEVRQHAKDIVVYAIQTDLEIRDKIRSKRADVTLITKPKPKQNIPKKYASVSNVKTRLSSLQSHRILAINRAEKEGFISVSLQFPDRFVMFVLREKFLGDSCNKQFKGMLIDAIDIAWSKYLRPTMSREFRSHVTKEAQEHSVQVFGDNLNHLLMTQPIIGRTILGFDPGFRHGCKLAVIDKSSSILHTTTIYPHLGPNNWSKAMAKFVEVLHRYEVDIVAIGDGTACGESIEFVNKASQSVPVSFSVVSEAGASVWSASDDAEAELGELDVALRSAVSIARRLMNPLSELVKIDPKSLGIGQYQHDLNGLDDQLDFVVINAVNEVGVDVNSASKALLRRVSGLTEKTAAAIVNYRSMYGEFRYREEILKVPGIGPVTFKNAAGFLRVYNSTRSELDSLLIHPENYKLADKLLKLDPELQSSPESLAKSLDAQDSVQTITDIIHAIKNPAFDPRFELPNEPLLRDRIVQESDLEPGTQIKGVVRNVTDFGAFYDIGCKTNGLLHSSQFGPGDNIHVGKTSNLVILDVNLKQGRINLGIEGKTNKRSRWRDDSRHDSSSSRGSSSNNNKKRKSKSNGKRGKKGKQVIRS